ASVHPLSWHPGLHADPAAVTIGADPASPPPRPTRKVDSTLVSSRTESDDLRRRIANPANPEFDLNLEEIEEEAADVEEISLDSPSITSLDELVPPVMAPPVPPKVPAGAVRTAPVPAAAPRGAGPPVAVRTEAPVPRMMPANNPVPAPGGNSSRPVDVKVEVGAGETQVSVPIDIAIEPGTTKVSLNLRLTLNVKRPR